MPEMSEYIQLLRKMGHDMRVPLNTIISTGDMLAQGVYDPLTPKQEKAIVRVQRNNRRLLAILDDFVTYIRADAGDLVLSPKPFEPRLHLEEWCKPVRPTIEEKNLGFHITTSASVPSTFTGDEAVIKRIVQALLWNAAAYTQTGEIRVTSDWTANQEWLICVQDSGSGISDNELPHIFEPFWRGEERPQMPTAGAGLGLPIAKRCVEAHGGTISVKSKKGEGTTVMIQIPLQLSVA